MLRPALPQIEWQGPGFCLSTDLRYLTKLYRSPCRGGAGALGDRDTVRAGAVDDIPQGCGAVGAACGQGAPVWAERHHDYPALAHQGGEAAGAVDDIPQGCGAVGAACGQGAPVWAERHHVYPALAHQGGWAAGAVDDIAEGCGAVG